VTILSEQVGFDVRAVEAAAAVASAPADEVLLVFQDQAIRLYARADADMIVRGDVSETLQEIARRNGIESRAGGAESLQHILSEATHGRRALYPIGATDGADEHKQRAQLNNHGRDAAPLEWLDMSKWDNEPMPKRRWAIKDRVPLKQAGLFSGEGGTGKSILELMKDVAHVVGKDWLGSMPELGPAIYVGAEDDEDEIHIRLAEIARHYSVTFKELIEHGLLVLCLLGKDATLCAAGKGGRVEVTDLYRQLFEAAGDIKPKNISIDTLSRAFAGNEIDRVQVYAFAMHMQALAAVAGGSVTVLSHPSLAGIASGSGISGSTAWHGAFRFRQYLKSTKPANDGEQPDNDLRELQFKKNQYGPTAETIVLRYQRGLFLPEGGMSSLDKMAREAKADGIFLELLKRFGGTGRNVSHNENSKTYAPTAFAKEVEAKNNGLQKADFEGAMRRLFDNKIYVENYGRPSRPYSRLCLKYPPCIMRVSPVYRACIMRACIRLPTLCEDARMHAEGRHKHRGKR
jgi:RecA-family ATPase